MQLNIIGNSIRPLTIAVGLAVTSPSMYAALDQHSTISSVVTSHQTESYLKMVDNVDEKYQRLQIRFKILYESWKEKTAFLSSPKSIVDNPEFKGIVSMGKDAVPFIINAIDEDPSQLVWALNYIFDAKISNNPQITITEACKLWVKRIKS